MLWKTTLCVLYSKRLWEVQYRIWYFKSSARCVRTSYWCCPYNKFFFQQSITSILTAFPLLFDTTSREDGDADGEETDANQINQGNGLTQFGIIPYLLKYCEVTNETLTDVMNESINLIFYIVSYEVLKAKEQERQLKQIRNK